MSEQSERRDFGTLKLRGRIWWARYRVGGKETWESLKTTSQREAEKKLAVLADRVGRGEHIAPTARRVMFADLERMLQDHYSREGLRSWDRAKYAVAHLRERFGSARALGITADAINSYEADRQAEGAKRATVNYELALLRKMFKLAIEKKRLVTMPSISIPDPKNARTGFFEADDFAAVLAELPAHLKPIFRFAYLTGWRVQSEVLPLTWDRVDFAAGVVRLDVGTTKNDSGRAFPFDALPDLAALLREQREYTTAVEREAGRIIPNVFHRSGKPIKSYKHGWHAACDRASVAGKGAVAVVVRPQLIGRIAHDFRRTAVRNLVRAGVPERVAMQLTGHKTREVFDRYDIVNEADLRSGVAKLAVHLNPDSKQAEKGTAGGHSPIQLVGGGR